MSDQDPHSNPFAHQPSSPPPPPTVPVGAAQPAPAGPSGLAIASLVCGITSVCLFCLSCVSLPVGIAGLVCALVDKSRSSIRTAGLICSSIGIAISLVTLVISVVVQLANPGVRP